MTLLSSHKCYRWASFREAVDETNKSVQAMDNGEQDVKFQHHIGGAIYVSVMNGYRCVNIRKWFQPEDLNGEIRPTKKGVALRFNEWRDLCTLITVINATFPPLNAAQPCFYDGDHMNQLGWLNCKECHPFSRN